MNRNFIHMALLLVPVILWGQKDSLVTVQTGSRTIQGSLMMPKQEKEIPVVLIIPGSGPTDRDGNNGLMKNNSLKLLAEGLYENGIASLRYDKRGLKGNPMGDQKEADLIFDEFVEDAMLWIRYLQGLQGISDIHVLGHSQGSLVGILAAQDAEVQSIISVAGSGSPIDEIIREQLQMQPPVLQQASAVVLDSLEQGHEVKDIHPMLQALFRPSVQPFLRSWMQFDPADEVGKLDQPVLIVNGTTDIQVGIEQAQKLKAASTHGNLLILENMNHVLKTASAERNENLKTYYDPELPLSAELVPAIVAFITSQ